MEIDGCSERFESPKRINLFIARVLFAKKSSQLKIRQMTSLFLYIVLPQRLNCYVSRGQHNYAFNSLSCNSRTSQSTFLVYDIPTGTTFTSDVSDSFGALSQNIRCAIGSDF